jgi:hypothetical protein
MCTPFLFDSDSYLFTKTISFADRDMFMRYLGGGVGRYQVDIPPEEDPAPLEDHEEDFIGPEADTP